MPISGGAGQGGGLVGRSRGERGSPFGRRLGGSLICRCKGCGYTQPHRRGVPCSSFTCPKCGKRLHGEHCG
jgi:hypothetical protein